MGHQPTGGGWEAIWPVVFLLDLAARRSPHHWLDWCAGSAFFVAVHPGTHAVDALVFAVAAGICEARHLAAAHTDTSSPRPFAPEEVEAFGQGDGADDATDIRTRNGRSGGVRLMLLGRSRRSGNRPQFSDKLSPPAPIFRSVTRASWLRDAYRGYLAQYAEGGRGVDDTF